jgi:hypothetical protein
MAGAITSERVAKTEKFGHEITRSIRATKSETEDEPGCDRGEGAQLLEKTRVGLRFN